METIRYRFGIIVVLSLASGVLAIAGASASAEVTIAAQNFDENTLSRGIPAEHIAVALGFYDDTTGVYDVPGLGFDGEGLGWTYFTDASTPEGVTRGNDAGDVIGVVMDDSKDFGTTNGLFGAPGQTESFYLVEDADSTWTVAFDPVDTSGYKNLMLSFTWGVDNDGGGVPAGPGSNFEVDDYIEVTVNGVSVFKMDGAGDYSLGDATGGLDDLDAPYINAFAPENVDISAFDGQILNINFAIANNTAPEDIAFDNVLISGDVSELLPCDINGDGVCDAADIDAMSQKVIDGMATTVDRDALIESSSPDGFNTYIGDSDLNGQFDEQDIVAAFIAGQYLSGGAAGWADGDWDGNLSFDDQDFVAAFISGGYLQGPRAVAAVPEPSSLVLFLLGALAVIRPRR